MNEIFFYRFRSVLGEIYLGATKKGLYSLEFARHKGSIRYRKDMPQAVADVLSRAARRIQFFLKGRKVDFEDLPIDWFGSRGLERRVLEKLRHICWGRTESYQGLARRAGRPRAARYVGQVLHRNRLPFIIPCHRIVSKNGGIGGFSKGIRIKGYLLKLESSSVDKNLGSKGVSARRLTGRARVL